MRRNWIWVAMLVVTSLLLTACPSSVPAGTGTADTAAAPAAGEEAAGGGTLIVGRGGDSVGLDSGTQTDGESARVINTIVDGLVALAGTSTEPIPWLAESWETADSQTWTFHLREGVTFHDGSTFDANDVVATWTAGLDASSPLHKGNTGAFEYYTNLWGGLMNNP